MYVERLPSRPILKNELRNMTVTAGYNATLRCNVISDQPPFITWLQHPTNDSTINAVNGKIKNKLFVIKVDLRSLICWEIWSLVFSLGIL